MTVQQGVKRILLIDDDDIVRRGIARMLRRQPVEITEATDGLDALGKLRTAEFDLVICDVSMPRMTGRDLLRILQQSLPGVLDRFVFHTGEPWLVEGLGPVVVDKGDLNKLRELVASV